MSNQYDDHQPPVRTVKVTHLVFGLIFCGIVTMWALGMHGVLGSGDVPFLFPAVLIGAGAIGLAAALAAGARGRRRTPSIGYAGGYGAAPYDTASDTGAYDAAPDTASHEATSQDVDADTTRIDTHATGTRRIDTAAYDTAPDTASLQTTSQDVDADTTRIDTTPIEADEPDTHEPDTTRIDTDEPDDTEESR